mmetsp:Transcript_29537/g.68121  ORF Transcript_29537/g.68121 Transcript_29537/m.68121 type:complete len:421 (-) Transcript_29537:87-1349(-)
MKVTSFSLSAGGLRNAIAACAVICAGATSFGPNDCVSLTRSRASTCVLRTQCQGLDLSNFEFAFDCDTGADVIETHSFGLGGFDAVEEFDTEVKCRQCLQPSTGSSAASTEQSPEVASQEQAVAVEAAAQQARSENGDEIKTQYHPALPSMVATARRQAMNQGSSKNLSGDSLFDSGLKAMGTAVQYGPNGCVSTYKSSAGHCIMETSCQEEDIQNYEFGLVCVDDVGIPTKHLFGKGSFDPVETFDTLIVCEQCLGLEDIPDEVALNGQVAMLSKQVEELEKQMENVTQDVAMLNKKALGGNIAPAPAAVPPDAPQMLLHHRRALRRIVPHEQVTHRHSRHHAAARNQRRQDDSDDEDEPPRPKRYLRHHAEHSERLSNANAAEQAYADDANDEDGGKAPERGTDTVAEQDTQDDEQDE